MHFCAIPAEMRIVAARFEAYPAHREDAHRS
jgi:hypothetical protein